ncbi:MAG TPA: AraC family transcriptional regulator [Haliangiales bacterium]|nr:AraC family transcriptional regulator [Haliangiales bacterium]
MSEALRGVRITGALFLNAEYRAPWGFASPASSFYAAQLAPGTEHLVVFHLITEGEATARVAGHDDVPLRAGDIVVFPRGHAHRLWNGRIRELIDASHLLPALLGGRIGHERGGGAGATTRFICGYFGCERYAERLFLGGLPPVFKVHIRSDAAGAWIETSIRHAVSQAESGRAGRVALLSKLTEALFMETLCRYMDELPPERTGWLAGARDDTVGRALACLHRDPARAWTLADLAKAAGASRTVLAERFARFLGRSPLAYLALWRMQLGARLLETTDRSVREVAGEVGYESEPAFNRAFKRALGLPPARYRRHRREARG